MLIGSENLIASIDLRLPIKPVSDLTSGLKFNSTSLVVANNSDGIDDPFVNAFIGGIIGGIF